MLKLRRKDLQIIGVASCWGAQDHGCSQGPEVLKQQAIEARLGKAQWQTMIRSNQPPVSDDDVLRVIAQVCEQLQTQVQQVLEKEQQFLVLGGDHSCAIGTWTGARQSLATDETLGLLWVDAHMDSHTPQTSHTGAVHGMPLACLLGHGDESLCHTTAPVLAPENVCLLGIRSYESGEAQLLQSLGVKVYFMDEIKRRGLAAVFDEAMAHISQQTTAVGISIDLDAIDPSQAPGVGSPEQDGLDGMQLMNCLQRFNHLPNLIGLEIAEYNPLHDDQDKTAKLVVDLAQALFEKGKA